MQKAVSVLRGEVVAKAIQKAWEGWGACPERPERDITGDPVQRGLRLDCSSLECQNKWELH